MALGILLELGVQRGTLQHMLEVILLLLELWDSGQDNDTDSCFTSAPLIHLLRRFEEVTGASHKALEPNKLAEEVDFHSLQDLMKLTHLQPYFYFCEQLTQLRTPLLIEVTCTLVLKKVTNN